MSIRTLHIIIGMEIVIVSMLWFIGIVECGLVLIAHYVETVRLWQLRFGTFIAVGLQPHPDFLRSTCN